MHWYRDCPKKATKSNNVSSFRASPNRIPVDSSGFKWPTYNAGSKPNTQGKFERKEARMNSVRLDADVIEIGLPEQDNDGFDDINDALCNKKSLCNNIQSKDNHLQNRHSDKVPTFAMAKIGNKEGNAHQVCIDTGSAISLIDAQYLRKNFPNIKVNPSSTIMLRGVGNNQTHGWYHADIHFINTDKQLTTISGAFHVVTSLATKIIIGNDVLAEEGATIDLNGGNCTFKSAKGIVPITSVRPKVLPASHPSARLQSVFTIKPGFQARVPIDLTDKPPTSLYMLDPVSVCEDL
jgi:hypothetical protein